METLFQNADLAMYFAKRQGPGRIAYFNETMNSGGLCRLTLESKMRDALTQKEFTLHFQPQFDLRTGTIAGFEALLRWTSADLGPVPPDDFIPVAEETGLILPIGHWVLQSACAQMKAWRDAGLMQGHIAVNVSGLQFRQRDFTAQIATVLRETGLPPACLEIEITESMMMKDEGSARQAFAQLKALGVTVAIDDFGTGYSSLSRLRHLPIDRVKIDRSFVRDLHNNMQDRAVVSAIIKMAQTLGFGVVAEGVEHFSQVLYLQGEQCDLAQGYLLSQPLSASEAIALLEQLAQSTDTSRTQRLAKVIDFRQALTTA